MKLSTEAIAKLEAFGAGSRDIQSIERVLKTSEVFCYAKPHADRFEASLESKAASVECLKAVLDGLRGWQGDTAREAKANVRRWIRYASKAAA